MVRRIRDTPAHCSSGCLGFHVSVMPASDSTRWSGSKELSLSSWHWLNLSCSSVERAKQAVVKSSRQRERERRKAILNNIDEAVINEITQLGGGGGEYEEWRFIGRKEG